MKTKEEDWIVVEGTHEAIVSKEVFDAVQEKLELNSRKRSKTHNNNYPLKIGKMWGMRSESTACNQMQSAL